MNFLYPYMLFGLLAISIPVIIHLFNFRRYQTVYFSSVRFLKNIKQETKAKSQLKHILILISRILMVACLVFAFSQPYISLNTEKKENVQNVAVYIDNSFSMTAEGENGRLLETAKSKAIEIASSYTATTKFLLLTNDFKAEHQHYINKEQLSDYISKVETSPYLRNFSEVCSKAASFTGNVQDLYLISDFQKTTSDIQNIKNDNQYLYFIPVQAQAVNNLLIDSCWFEMPEHKQGQTEELFVKITNHSETGYQNIPAKLYINDSLKAISSFNIDINTNVTISLKYTNTATGLIAGRVEITDYPVIYDNTMYFNYEIANKISVLCINNSDENPYLNSLFDNGIITLTNQSEKQVNYSDIPNYRVIILNEVSQVSSGMMQELIAFATGGGTIVVVPGPKTDVASLNQFLIQAGSPLLDKFDTSRTAVNKVNDANVIFKNSFKKLEKNADLPAIYGHYSLMANSRSLSESLLSTITGQDLLVLQPCGKGKVYLFTFCLKPSCSNFVTHPLFVPAMINIVSNSQPLQLVYYNLNDNRAIDIASAKSADEPVLHITGVHSKIDFIPYAQNIGTSVRLLLHNQMHEADNYNVSNSKSVISQLSFNYDRRESDMTFYSDEELQDIISKSMLKASVIQSNNKFLSKSISDFNQGIKLWKYFILGVLIFILIEVLLIKLWK